MAITINYPQSAYDFVTNEEGELMLIIDAPEGDADEDSVKFIYDGGHKGTLVRNSEQIIEIPFVADIYCEMLLDIETILVTEMDGEEIFDVYEASIEILNDKKPEDLERIEQMVKFYREMAESGNPLAMYELGMLYYDGVILEYDYGKAVEWMTKAAGLGLEKAVEFLAELQDEEGQYDPYVCKNRLILINNNFDYGKF